MVEYDQKTSQEFEVADIARTECWDHVEPKRVRTLDDGRIMLECNEDSTPQRHSPFCGQNLRPFLEGGYLPISVDKKTIWLYPIDISLELPIRNRP